MYSYYLDYSPSVNGIRYIHKKGCLNLRNQLNSLYLGDYSGVCSVEEFIQKEFPEWKIRYCHDCCLKWVVSL